jgi:hypothetical protein
MLWPLGVNERLDASIKLYRVSFRKFAAAILVVGVPIALIDGLFQWWRTSTIVSSSALVARHADGTETIHWAVLEPEIGALALSLVLGFVLNSLTKTIAYGLFGATYLGRPTTWRGGLQTGLRRVPSQLWIVLLIDGPIVLAWGSLVLVGIALVHASATLGLLLIPLSFAALAAEIWWSVINLLAVPSLMMEGMRGTTALRRSWALVRGTWWSVFGTVLLAAVLVFIITLIVNAILGVIVGAVALHLGTHAFVLGSLEGMATLLFFTPFRCAIATVLTVDMRVRKEGLDLELLTEGQSREGGAFDFLPQPKSRWAPPVTPGTWPGPTDPPGTTDPPEGPWPPPPQ